MQEKAKASAAEPRAYPAKTSVKLSHPDKLLWPDEKVSKQDLLDHYALVWPRMEPFVVNRPLSLVRAPDGIHGPRFFQKHASPGMSGKIARMKDPAGGEEILFIEDLSTKPSRLIVCEDSICTASISSSSIWTKSPSLTS